MSTTMHCPHVWIHGINPGSNARPTVAVSQWRNLSVISSTKGVKIPNAA